MGGELSLAPKRLSCCPTAAPLLVPPKVAVGEQNKEDCNSFRFSLFFFVFAVKREIYGVKRHRVCTRFALKKEIGLQLSETFKTLTPSLT